MSDIEVKKTCPLGHTCRKVVGDHIEECVWYIHMEGENPQNGESMDRAECAMVWQPFLMIEGNRETYKVGANLQDLKNETIVRQDAFLGVVANAKRSIEHR